MKADIEKVEMSMEEIPLFHKRAAQVGKTLIVLGNMKKSNADFFARKRMCRAYMPSDFAGKDI